MLLGSYITYLAGRQSLGLCGARRFLKTHTAPFTLTEPGKTGSQPVRYSLQDTLA